MTSQCNRAGCGTPAASSLSYDYAARTAWLLPTAEPHPARYGLCQRHADTLRVPLGWTLEDRRSRAADLDAATAS